MTLYVPVGTKLNGETLWFAEVTTDVVDKSLVTLIGMFNALNERNPAHCANVRPQEFPNSTD